MLAISRILVCPDGSTDTVVRIKAHVMQHGRTMALIKGEMTSVDGKTVYVTVEHHKVNVPTRPEHLSMREVMRQQKKGAEERAKL
jgi:hypothetical protein